MPFRPAIASHSLGRACVHNLEPKLDEAARYGFDIELFYEDLEYLARAQSDSTSPRSLLEAAKTVRTMCDARGISIICLQPFMNYEGLRDRQRHAERIEEFKLWTQIATELHTPIIAIPSSILSEEEASGDIDLIVQDLREVADLAAPEGLEIAYESLAWGTYSETWEQSWEVVQLVDRANFGICLDTFNIAARVFGDPTAPNRKSVGAEAAMRASLEKLVRAVVPQKISFVQVVDAEYLAEPLVESHEYYDPDQPPRMSWSRNCRLFYGEEERGGFLPIREILKAILVDLKPECSVSAELFNKSLFDPSPAVPAQHARRAAQSWWKIVDEFGIAPTRRLKEEPAPSVWSTRAQL